MRTGLLLALAVLLSGCYVGYGGWHGGGYHHEHSYYH